MTVKFYVWAGGRWCEVCPVSGRVTGAGWRGKARFVFLRRGHLLLARSKSVLKGLRDLAARRPTSVRAGARLPKRRRKQRKHPQCSGCHHGCFSSHKPSANDESVKSAERTHVDAGVQADVPGFEPAHSVTKPLAEDSRCSSPAVNGPSPIATDDGSLAEDYKELIINEDDVDIYRSYLIKTNPNFDLLRFDWDENYKLRTFYKINPLVAIEKCERLERMLRASPSSQDNISLQDFATKLGLRSTSEPEKVNRNRYRMRRRDIAKSEKASSIEDADKENHVQGMNRIQRSGVNIKILNTVENKNLKKMMEAVKRNISNESKQGTKKHVAAAQPAPAQSDESGLDYVNNNPDNTEKQIPAIRMYPMKFQKNKTSKTCNGYSNLEDHAILAFISAGRSRRVNGNSVWQELALQFPALTGIERTFHSLRNRYLRYILPSLQQFALSPSHAARLRADAAAGEIKSRKKSGDPYPFSYPRVRSAFAASRPARPGLSDLPDTPPTGTRSPPQRDKPRPKQAHSAKKTTEGEPSPEKRELRNRSLRENRARSPPAQERKSVSPARLSRSRKREGSPLVSQSLLPRARSLRRRNRSVSPAPKEKRDTSSSSSSSSFSPARGSSKRSRPSSGSPVRPVKKPISTISVSSTDSGTSPMRSEPEARASRSTDRTLRSRSRAADHTPSEPVPRTLRSSTTPRAEARPRTRKLYNHNMRPLR